MRDLVRNFQGLVAKLVRGNQIIAKADLERLFSPDPPPGIEKLRCFLLPNQSRKGHGEAESMMKAQASEVRGEASLRAGDSKVRH